MQIEQTTASTGGIVNNLKMTGKESGGESDSLWINTPRGMIHVFIGCDGMIDLTIWNSKLAPATKITKKKKSEGITYINQVLK